MKIDLKIQTSGQLVDALVQLDKLRLQTARSIDMYKAELQARGVSIMDDRNQQYIRFYGDGGSASITDKQKLDLTNPDRLQKWLPEGVYKKNVSETTETKYKLTTGFETMLKSVATGDYTFEMSLEDMMDQLHIVPDDKQRKLLLKKLTGEFEKDRKTLNAVFKAEESWEEELYYMLSKVVPIGAKAGNMSLQITEELGFMNRPVIVSGCHDQIAAAIGSGVFNERHGVDGTGTVECITVAFSKDQKIDKMLLQKSGFAIVPYMKDLFVTYAFSYTGGALLKWYRDKVSPMEAKKAYENGQNPYEVYNRGVSDGEPSELLILPYFAGAGTPYMDNSAKGIIAGLTMDTSKEKIYQGIMEGCSYEMKLNLDYLQKAGIAVEKLFATGGGANSKEWLHIKADIYDKEIISLGAAESGTVACILLAGAACGRFRNLEEASKVFITYRDTYFPRKGVKEKYKKLFDQYRMIYPRLYEK